MPSYLRIAQDDVVIFFCPACQRGHSVTINGKKNSRGFTWNWNGLRESPTFTPSIRVENPCLPLRNSDCHCTITNGKIHYEMDCLHTFAGRTVDMVDIGEW